MNTEIVFNTTIEKDYDDSIIVRDGAKLTVLGDVYRPIEVKANGAVIIRGHVDTLILYRTAKCFIYGTCRQMAIRHGACWCHSVHICGGLVEHVHCDNGEIIVSGNAYIKELVLEPGRLITRGKARIDQVRMNRWSYLRLREDTVVPHIKASQGAAIELQNRFTTTQSFKQNHQLKQGVRITYRD